MLGLAVVLIFLLFLFGGPVNILTAFVNWLMDFFYGEEE